MIIKNKPGNPFEKEVQIPEIGKKRNKELVMSSISSLERVLVNRLKNGDSKAFSSIFTAYYRDLVIFAARFTREISSAEEIVEDTFVSFWEDRELIKISISLKSYLLKIVQNRCIDWLRHKKTVQTHYEYSLLNSPKSIANTDSYLLFSELNEQIQTTLKLLPDQISETFRMNREKGLKYNEIAEILGVSVRTVEVRIGRALSLLRSHLKDYLQRS